MPSKPTWIICGEGLKDAYNKKQISLRFGIDVGGVRSWTYSPDKWGKANPLDSCVRYITFVHAYDPANAREAAQHMVEVCNELDEAEGIREACSPDGIVACLQNKVREGCDVIVLLAGGQFDLLTLRQARHEIAEERASLEQLDAAIAEAIRQREIQDLQSMNRTA